MVLHRLYYSEVKH